jgi:hypothetical protein
MNKSFNNYVFIDSQNLNLGILGLGWKLDFRRFHTYLVDKYGATKVFLFIGYVSGNELLYARLQDAGYVVIFKPTLTPPNRKPKGNVDAELVLHAMIEYKNYDNAIIVSGDGDFYCLVEYLYGKGKLGYVIVPNRKKYSALLRRFTDYIIYLDRLSDKLGEKTN